MSHSQDFDINLAKWSEDVEEISYIDYPFIVTHFYLKPPANIKQQQDDTIQKTQSGGDNSSSPDRKGT